jgi:DNA-binding PadR family transcriptional regulator
VATKYAVLGLIMERRGYGYDLAQRLAERLGPAWRLNPAAVYQALNQLESEGMVRGCERPSSLRSNGDRRRQPRLVYEATERGREALQSWLLAPALRQEPIRSELALKLAVAQASAEELRAVIDQAERLLKGALVECRLSEEAVGLRKPGVARTAALFRLEGELDWLAAVRPILSPALR